MTSRPADATPAPRRPWWRPRTPDAGSYRRQIIASTALLGGLVAVVLVVVVQVVLAGSSSSAVQRVLTDRAEAVVSSTDAASSGDRLAVPDAQLDPGVAVYRDGALVAGQVPASQRDAFTDLSTTPTGRSQSVEDRYELYAEPFTTGGGVHGVVVLAEPLAPYEHDEQTALLLSVLAGVVVVGLATALAAWASRRALEPVARMASTAADWSEHDLDRRFDLGPPTNEVRALGRTLDGLLGRVATAIVAEQRLTSELAHELRSPLTVVQGTAELVALRDDLDDELREDLDRIVTACHDMAATITGLLDLARGLGPDGSTATGRPARVPVSEVLDRVLRGLGEPERVDVDGSEGAGSGDGPVLAVPAALAVRALAPVVDNAVRLAAHVQVGVETREGMARIVVRDDGPGVASAEAERIFEPSVTSGTGAGLGLPLARRVARSVGGDVVVTPADRGATFVVTLPVAPA